MRQLTIRADEVQPGDITVDLPCEMDYTVRKVSRAPISELNPADIAAAGGWVVLAGDTEDGYYRRAYEDDQEYYAAPDQMITVLRPTLAFPRLTAAGLRTLLDTAYWVKRCGGHYFTNGAENTASKRLERDGFVERSATQRRCIKLAELGAAWVQALSLAETSVGLYCSIANSHTAATGVRMDAKLQAAATIRRVFSNLTQEQAELVVIQAHATQASIVKVIRDSGYIR